LLVERWISRFLASLKVAANCEMLVVWIARHIGPFRAAEHLTYWTYSTLCNFPFKKIAVRLVECSLLHTDFAYCWFFFFFFSFSTCFFLFFSFLFKYKEEICIWKNNNKSEKIETNQMPNRFFLPCQVYKHKFFFSSLCLGFGFFFKNQTKNML